MLVTARHLVDPVWACKAPQNPTALYARVNKKVFDPTKDASGVEFIRLSLVADERFIAIVSVDAST